MSRFNFEERRQCTEGFLNDYLAYNKSLQSPEDFHLWVGLSIMSMCLERKVYLDRGKYKLYPNLYVILVGESASGKSTAISQGKELLGKAFGQEMIFLSQKFTPEKLIHALSLVHEKRKVSAANLISSEFSVLVGQCRKDPTLLQILTDLYDCPEFWSYSTLARGIDTCNRLYLNILAGSTPDWLKSSLPDDAIGGGFFSRIIHVFRTELVKKVPNPEDGITPELLKAGENCVADLLLLRGISGTFAWEPKAKQIYTDWYMEYWKPEEAPHFLRGYMGRKGDTILKIAMLCSLSFSNKLVLTPRDINFAISILNENETYMKDVMKVIGQNDQGKSLERVLFLIKKHKVLTHSKLLQSVSHNINADELELIIKTLDQSGQITIHMEGRQKYYQSAV